MTEDDYRRKDAAEFMAKHTKDWPAVKPDGSRWELFSTGVVKCNGAVQYPEHLLSA
jgi:hypothetical protein